MELFVYSRAAIERLPPHVVPHVIISITSSPDDVARLPSSDACLGVLRLSFPDLETPAPERPDDIFGAAHAEAICAFVVQHRARIERIVVHCDAGVSRSPAVAAALAACLGEDEAEFVRRYRPNTHVYRTLVEAWRARGGA